MTRGQINFHPTRVAIHDAKNLGATSNKESQRAGAFSQLSRSPAALGRLGLNLSALRFVFHADEHAVMRPARMRCEGVAVPWFG